MDNSNQIASQADGRKKAKGASRGSIRRGGYFAAVISASIAIVVIFNVAISLLPAKATQFDISDSKIYSISDVSVEFINSLSANIELVMLEETSSVDPRVLKFIESYAALSDNITLTRIDPTINPTALEEYDAQSGNIVVVNKDNGKQTSVALSGMITYDESYLYYYNQYYETGFDAEGQITSAVNYVTSETTSKVYFMQGHGESGVADTLVDLIQKLNLSTEYVNLLEAGTVPEDCDLLLSNAPAGDLSDVELSTLLDYMSNGGNLLLVCPSTEENHSNWQTLLSSYGLKQADGFVGDLERYYSSLQSYYAFFPILSPSSTVTSDIKSDSMALLLNTRGFIETETDRDVTIDGFMTTSANGFLGSDTDNLGTFLLGAKVTEETDSGASSLIVLGSQYLIDSEILSSYSSLANSDIFINSVTDSMEDLTNISIAAKSLSVYKNTVTNPELWGIMFIVLIPVLTLGGGLFFWIRRRKQ